MTTRSSSAPSAARWTAARFAGAAAWLVLAGGCSSNPRAGAGASDASAAPPSTVDAGRDAASASPSRDAATPSDAASPGPPDAGTVGTGLGAATFGAGDLDPPSNGGTITFQQIGAAGWYPSRRDPARGPCDALDSGTCCMATDTISSNALTPWDEELVMTLRGPMQVKQLAVYQPGADASTWDLVSSWDDRSPAAAANFAFSGDATPKASFAGGVGSECIVNVATAQPFACGAGSSPYCPPGSSTDTWGWAGSKLFVLLARMGHAGGSAPAACSTTTTGNWYDAPWIGLAVGELARAGSFASCQCFAKDPANWALADGCGQFNVFEVVNDNDSSKNLDVFSTNFIDYAGYVGQGPCGAACDAGAWPAALDLVDKANDQEAKAGATATSSGGPTAAFRRPESGYRYFVVLLDVPSRTVQLGLVHPQRIPAALAPILPALPSSFAASAESAVLGLRLPR